MDTLDSCFPNLPIPQAKLDQHVWCHFIIDELMNSLKKQLVFAFLTLGVHWIGYIVRKPTTIDATKQDNKKKANNSLAS